MSFNISQIIDGYAQGYFLMAEEDGELNWYSSRKRAIIPLDDRFRYPKSLQRVLNQKRFQVAIDRDFEAVVNGCADRDVTCQMHSCSSISRFSSSPGYRGVVALE